MEKMTKREFYTAIMNGEINDQVKLFASTELDRMDVANKKRREAVSKKAQENLPLLEEIMNEILTDEPKTATDVAAILEVSVQKASSLLRRLVEEGKAEKTDIKIKGKGTQKAYSKVEGAEEPFEVNPNDEIVHVTE